MNPSHAKNRLLLSLGLAATLALGACGTTSKSSSPAPVATNQPDPTILLVPVQINDPALQSGCWAQFYSKRNFEGDMMTLVGPSQIMSMDNGTARQLKREIDSVRVGPRATLQVYEHAMFRDRTVSFPANSREGGLITKLGFGGRIEAMKLSCS
ncbi:beta/gamma crystallin domain-containing protein [Variovorax sp. KK3]|uniref:beta/gamma crystallin domain-containing protein n=1 Tax=Variovorax sp. KK3 TaxID=1855728 RepID=UPI00097BF4E2|nr:beta/gamma crystallin domain-containing protein [Variovorax sp. KK3]